MQFESDNLKKASILKLAFRLEGVDIDFHVPGVGQSIKEDIKGLYKIDDFGSLKPNELVIYKNITTKFVFNPLSRFKLVQNDGSFSVISKKSGKKLSEVSFTRRPKHYGLLTSNGVPMKNIAQVMGSDCLSIAVDKQCHYFTNGDFCRYCNITPTNIDSGISRLSDPQDIFETLSFAAKNYKFFNLTGGTFADRDEELRAYIKIGRIIKDSVGNGRYSGPFSPSPPKNLDLLADLYETGVDVISFNPDIMSPSAFNKICPGKAKIGKEYYELALEEARKIWGDGNAVAQYMIGPWETSGELLEGIKRHLDRGILVNLTTFCPSPVSSFKNKKTKSLQEIVSIYIQYGELVRQSGLYPNKRGSILTSESANRSSLSNEAAKCYLSHDNYNPYKDLDEILGDN